MPRRSQRTLEGETLRAEIVALRRQRLSQQEIARRLGISQQRVSQLYRQTLAEIPAQQVDEHRLEDLEQLDYLASKAIEVLERQHVTVSNGRVVSLNDEPIEDDAPVLAAIAALLKVQERKAKLLGLDAPTKHEVVTLDAIDAEIARLNAELAGGTAVAETPTVEGSSS